MRVKCVKEYYDLQLKKTVNVGKVYDVPADRAKELASTNNKAGAVLVAILEEAEPEQDTEPEEKPAKGRKKKKEE